MRTESRPPSRRSAVAAASICLRAGNVEGKVETDIFGRTNAPLEAVNRSVITPGKAELDSNPRSRSAKLRVAVKRSRD